MQTDFAIEQVSITVDWLSFTVKWEKLKKHEWQTHDAQMVTIENITKVGAGWQRDIPLHGYEDCWINKWAGGFRVMVSRPGDRMGVHFQLPGQAMQYVGVEKALAFCRELDGATTRIDIAIDYFGDAKPSELYAAHIAGRVKTRAKKVNLITGTDGDTAYFGGRVSEQYLRVYDKAAQTKTPTAWTRIELECKGRKAKWVFQELTERGLAAIPAMVKAFAACPDLDWYNFATNVTNVALGQPQAKKITDTRAWLMGTVAKTLAKEAINDDAFLGEFVDLVLRLKRTGSVDETGF